MRLRNSSNPPLAHCACVYMRLGEFYIPLHMNYVMINSLFFSICFILIFKERIIYLALNYIKLFDFIKYMIFDNFGKIMYHIGEICHI